MNGPLAPWLTGAALLVLAVIGVVIRHRFEERESGPDRHDDARGRGEEGGGGPRP